MEVGRHDPTSLCVNKFAVHPTTIVTLSTLVLHRLAGPTQQPMASIKASNSVVRLRSAILTWDNLVSENL